MNAFIGPCGGDLWPTIDVEEIKTPNYPFGYPSNAHCIWRIHGYPGVYVTVRIYNATLESNYDFLYISQNGTGNATSSNTTSLTGDINEEFFFDFRNGDVIIEFQSDSSVEKKGARITYQGSKDYGKDEKISKGELHWIF